MWHLWCVCVCSCIGIGFKFCPLLLLYLPAYNVVISLWATPILFVIFRDRISVHGVENTGMAASGLHISFLQMMWHCWLNKTMTSSVHWGSLKWQGRVWGHGTLLWASHCPKWRSSKHFGILFTSEGEMVRDIDQRIDCSSAVMRTVLAKRQLSLKMKQLIYFPTLT